MSERVSLCECAALEAKYVESMEMNVDQKYLTSSDYVNCRKSAERDCPVHGGKQGA